SLVVGVTHMHRRKIVHRNLNPKNILMDNNDTPKICGFGNSTLLINGQPRQLKAWKWVSSAEDTYKGTMLPYEWILQLASELRVDSWLIRVVKQAQIRGLYCDKKPHGSNFFWAYLFVNLDLHLFYTSKGQQHTEQPEFNNEGKVDQNAEQCHDIRPLPAKLTDDKTIELSDQSLESENVQQSQFLKEKGRMKQLHKEKEHLKQTYKDLFDSIKRTRVQTKDQNDSLMAQLNKKSE
ncbi:putative ribonuclease H-like domain-containing protein, partial [Tanacetum coccineum]